MRRSLGWTRVLLLPRSSSAQPSGCAWQKRLLRDRWRGRLLRSSFRCSVGLSHRQADGSGRNVMERADPCMRDMRYPIGGISDAFG